MKCFVNFRHILRWKMYGYAFLSRRLKCCYVAFVLLILILYVLNSCTTVNRVSVNLKHVVVHLDLKGAPPQIKYLERLLPLFVKIGVSGILIEYEDMFPYEGKLVNLSSRYRYDRTELTTFLNKVDQYEIEVIPLIQTMGHMEHVLKLKEFQHLREDPIYPDSICPSNDESIELIQQMLEQIMLFHNNIALLKHIHIGCDEVFHINQCQKCHERRIAKGDIFYSHINKIEEIITHINPHTNILIWDDMLREMIAHQINDKNNIEFHRIEPVYWDYRPKLDVSHINLFQYHKLFKNIWIASAFKGADGRKATLSDFKARLENHHSWMTFILEYIFAGEKETFNFKGIVLTGWSRYSHMDQLCELFPPSFPNLVLNVLLIQKYRIGINKTDVALETFDFFKQHLAPVFYRELNCHHPINEFKDFEMMGEYCDFDGKGLLHVLKEYKKLKTKINDALYDEQFGFSVIDYYNKFGILKMDNFNEAISICKTYLQDLCNWKIKIRTEMSKFYDKFVIDEYVKYKIYALESRLTEIWNMLKEFGESHVHLRTLI